MSRMKPKHRMSQHEGAQPRPAAADVRACRVCGCTDADCSGCLERTGAPCSWVEADLCSACDDKLVGQYAARIARDAQVRTKAASPDPTITALFERWRTEAGRDKRSSPLPVGALMWLYLSLPKTMRDHIEEEFARFERTRADAHWLTRDYLRIGIPDVLPARLADNLEFYLLSISNKLTHALADFRVARVLRTPPAKQRKAAPRAKQAKKTKKRGQR